MLEAEPEQSSVSADESLSAKNTKLQNKVVQLTREKKELLKKVAHYEEYTKRLCTVLRKMKGSIDNLASQSVLIGEALSFNCETENDEQNEENVPEQPQIQTKKTMQTASVLPMVRGFPIRRIIVPLQRLNINSHRHRPNRIHVCGLGHRREPWWRETEQEPQEPRQEAHRANQRVPVRRMQRVERRQHRVVRPRSRPGARRRQDAAVVERAGTQNRRSGSSHQMLQAVVLLQRLSLTQHQQQQQRREQESQPLPSDGLRTPIVMLQDISTTLQVGDRLPQKPEEPLATNVKAEPMERSTAGPSVRVESSGDHKVVVSAGPSVDVDADTPPKLDRADACVQSSSNAGSENINAALSDAPETGEAKVETCEELPPILLPAEEDGNDTVGEKDAGIASLSESVPCSNEQPVETVNTEETISENETLAPQAVSLEAETELSSTTETNGDNCAPNDTSVISLESTHLHNGDTTSGQQEVSPQESEESSPDVDTISTEHGRERSLSPVSQDKEESSDSASSINRKRKASVSVDTPDKCCGSPQSDADGERSHLSESEQGCRPRRKCAVRKNYALFFAGWNAD